MSAPRSEDIAIGCSCGTGTCEDCAREMRAAILAVRQLHRPIKSKVGGSLNVCFACSQLLATIDVGLTGQPTEAFNRSIRNAGVAYPCATIRLLDQKGAPLAYGPSATA